MFRVNVNVYPSGSGGYVFRDSDGTVFRGKSWGGVARKVAQYRLNSGRVVGDVVTEVASQACARNPGICKEANQVVPAPRPSTLKGRVLTWLTTFVRIREARPLGFVDDATARTRANICAVCPRGKQLPGGCATCKQAIRELRLKVVGNQRITAMDQRLGACEELGVDLPTAVFLDEVRVTNEALPGNCWRKTGV
jgi:hypothetical protein